MEISKQGKIVSWVAQLVAAGILFQTLFFKFTGAEESVHIFSTLGMEPAGRYGSGFVELVAVVLLLIPSWCWLGALFGLGSMSGAIFFHLFFLGIEIRVGGESDNGLLFYLAIAVLLCCAIVLWIRRASIPIVGARFR